MTPARPTRPPNRAIAEHLPPSDSISVEGSNGVPIGSRRPVGGVDFPRSWQEFRDWFPDDAACVDYVADLRWRTGFTCPTCGADRSWRTADLSWMCTRCGRKTSVTAGTMLHRSHTPISTWLAAVWWATARRGGVSALELQRLLDLASYETAWTCLRKLRRAMRGLEQQPLADVVEVGETFILATGARTDLGRTPVMVAVERIGPRRLGRVRLAVGNHRDATTVTRFVRGSVGAHATRVESGADGAPPGVQLVASGLRRWVAGTLRNRVSREHLPDYLDEFTFRFNRRDVRVRGLLFYELVRELFAAEDGPGGADHTTALNPA